MSFLFAPTPAPADEEPAAPRSASAASAAIETALADRVPPPDIEPVLLEIRRVTGALAQHSRVQGDAHAMHLLEMMALAEDMEQFERFAEALRAYLVDVPRAPPGDGTQTPPAPSARASRVLLRL